ncbi:histidinol phosphate phosphatase HisJ family [Desulfotomaculum nigrificans CO-1-SRB]|uniref:Histidinol-phosphatase n=1 Tax=Desulfotomaculum nigrificans (strain DSM 14880 / VKM B-2319 / CO-1-SRB) TaxID=868595 RepID=F6B401_DESCC|nr:histidinol-phosphatase [Desulfotomaculum nigrificans]AEF94056.1 histidinol phosphate phosphatase HisJ family [Desulfotomaculum nigrificans CO-1-SRB]
MFLADYHVHPGYSLDAEDRSIDEYCQQALRLGLSEICFTPHYECDPVRQNIDWFVRVNGKVTPMDRWSWIDLYFTEIAAARQQYAKSGLAVKAGIEIGYDFGLEPVIEKLINNYPWDFILGSIHCLDHMAISSSRESVNYFPGRTARQVCDDYYNKVKAAVASGLFDCLGHLDIYQRYGHRFFGPEIEEVELPLAESVLKQMAASNIGMEINTSGLRKGYHCFPSSKILKLAAQCGVKIFTIGSDAHKKSDLGQGLVQAVKMLKQNKLNLYCFSRRVPTPVSTGEAMADKSM